MNGRTHILVAFTMVDSFLRVRIRLVRYAPPEVAPFERIPVAPMQVGLPAPTLQAAARIAPLLRGLTEMHAVNVRGEGKVLCERVSEPFPRDFISAMPVDVSQALMGLFGEESEWRHVEKKADVMEIMPNRKEVFETDTNMLCTFDIIMELIDENGDRVGNHMTWIISRGGLWRRHRSRDAKYPWFIRTSAMVVMYEAKADVYGIASEGAAHSGARGMIASWRRFCVCLSASHVVGTLKWMLVQ